MKLTSLLRTALVMTSLISGPAFAGVVVDFKTTLEMVRAKFDERYGLAPWKKAQFGWDADEAVRPILARAARDPNLTESRARKLIQDYFYSARDYHAKAIYAPGGYTALPIAVRVSGSHVFIVGVSETCQCGIVPGDEILKFNSEAALVAVARRSRYRYINHFGTDLRDAANTLTAPYGMLMDEMPTGATATLELRARDGSERTVTLAWGKNSAFNAAAIPAHPRVSENLRGWAKLPNATIGVGSYGSVFTKPDKVLWENSATSIFPAWIAELPGSAGKRVGTIRISDFAPGDAKDYTAAVVEFESLVDEMNQNADVLVLDTLANSGGMADYMYALASYFFDREVPTLQFSYRLFPEIVADANKTLVELDAIQTDAAAIAYFGADYYGFPVDLDFAREVADFYRGLSTDAAAGLKFSRKRFYNAARVKPNPRVRFLKPLYVLADERTASCGDFFAAYLQDLKRAKILGGWTMGAGGFTGGTARIDSPLKTNYLIVPIATGFRLDGKTVVENLGVLPDDWISPTSKDYTSNFSGFRERVFRAVSRGFSFR